MTKPPHLFLSQETDTERLITNVIYYYIASNCVTRSLLTWRGDPDRCPLLPTVVNEPDLITLAFR